MLTIRVLGAAAGGGFPQWNANSAACRRAREGDPAAPPATQASVAVSADGRDWLLLNASPDLRQQIEANSPLQPFSGLRSSPIAALLLTNGDVDAVAGLLHLREGTPFALYAEPHVLEILAANPIFRVLDPNLVPRRPLRVSGWQAVAKADGTPTGLEVRPFPVPGKIPLYLEGEADEAGPAPDRQAQDTEQSSSPHPEEARKGRLEGRGRGACAPDPSRPPAAAPQDEGFVSGVDTAVHTIGLEIRAGASRFFYVANCAALSDDLTARIAGAPLVFFDGTLYTDDEMIRQGVGRKTGRRMGHMSLDGPDGSLAALAGLDIGRKIFIHINNTNPILLKDSPERQRVEAAGFEVAHDGMELRL